MLYLSNAPVILNTYCLIRQSLKALFSGWHFQNNSTLWLRQHSKYAVKKSVKLQGYQSY